MKHLTLSLISLVSLAQALASPPTLYPRCPVRIATPRNSAGHFLSRDCRTLFVLPPSVGALSITSFAPNVDAKMCNVINLEMESIENEAKLLASRSAVNTSQSVASLEQSAKQLEVKCRQKQADVEYFNAKVESLEERFAKTGSRNDERSLSDAKRTQKLASADSEACTTELASLRSKIEVAIGGNPDHAKRWAALQERMLSLQTRYTKTTDGKNVEGAVMSVLLNLNMEKLLSDYRSTNPNLVVTPMPVQSILFFTAKSKNDAAVSATISVKVPGIRADATTVFKEMKLTDDSATGTGSTIFGQALSGQVTLTALGACVALQGRNPETVRAQPSLLGAHLTANVLHRYATQVSRAYSASYNLREVYKRIEEMRTSGGLFSSSSFHKLTKEAQSNKWVNIQFSSDDPTHGFDTIAMEKEITAQILEQALQPLTKAYEFVSPNASNPGQAPTTGAEAAASALHKVPNIYAQAAAIVLDIAQALFGSKEQRDEFLSTVDVTVNKQFSDDAMLYRVGTSTFKPSSGWGQ